MDKKYEQIARNLLSTFEGIADRESQVEILETAIRGTALISANEQREADAKIAESFYGDALYFGDLVRKDGRNPSPLIDEQIAKAIREQS
jgi:hypothetical protein